MPAHDSALLQVDQVRKAFGAVVALDDVTFSASSGERVGIIGANGAGKSTLLDVITGYLPADSGAVWLGGTQLSGRKADYVARRGVARTFQRVRVFARLTVEENVRLGWARTWGWRRATEGRTRTAELLGELGYASLANRLASELSLGQQRLVELARAVVGEPGVLVLDEPTSGLNDEERRFVGEWLNALVQRSAIVLIVEHELDIVRQLAQRVIALEAGRILLDGPTAAVLSSPEVAHSYLGEAVG